MKRLIEIANKQIEEYLLTLVGTETGAHLVLEDILAHNFNCMGTDIDWKDVPEDLDLTGYEMVPVNVLYDDCRLKIIFSEYRNCINIILPEWMKWALYAANIQGKDSCISLLTKLRHEEGCTKQKIEIGYDNTVG